MRIMYSIFILAVLAIPSFIVSSLASETVVWLAEALKNDILF